MVDTANEARAAAAAAATALRLVNEVAAESLIAAVDRGETRARLAIDPVQVAHATGRTGRLYDERLLEILDDAGARALARACRIFAALNFAVATVPEVERRDDVDGPIEQVSGIRITHLELGFATAAENLRAAGAGLLQAVALPAAHLWRARAETARRIEAYERKALALIAEHADRGAAACRLGWRAFGIGPSDAAQLRRLAERLRGRGFSVELLDASAALHVAW